MQSNVLQKRKSAEQVRCVKCGSREATKEDQMCDVCRFALTLENIIKSREKSS